MEPMYFPPHTVASLADVPPEWRGSYLPYRDGNKSFIIEARMWALVCSMREQIEALQTQIRELDEKRTADLAAEQAATKQERVNRTLGETLKNAGVRPGLVAGAVALLTDQYQFDVERAYDDSGWMLIAESPLTGLMSAEHVVNTFIESDEGAPFRSRERAVQVAVESRYGDWIAELKRRR